MDIASPREAFFENSSATSENLTTNQKMLERKPHGGSNPHHHHERRPGIRSAIAHRQILPKPDETHNARCNIWPLIRGADRPIDFSLVEEGLLRFGGVRKNFYFSSKKVSSTGNLKTSFFVPAVPVTTPPCSKIPYKNLDDVKSRDLGFEQEFRLAFTPIVITKMRWDTHTFFSFFHRSRSRGLSTYLSR